MSTIFQRVQHLIAAIKRMDPADLTLETTFEEIGLDSLDSLGLISDLEEEFRVSIPNEEVLNIRTVRQAVESLEKAAGEKIGS